MKRPFEVGDRVRVYGREWGPGAFNGITGPVTKISNDGLLTVSTRDMIYVCHPKQCRRLKPKPKVQAKGARKVWVGYTTAIGIDEFPDEVFAINPCNRRAYPFIEILPGQIITSETGLAKAIADFFVNTNNPRNASHVRAHVLAALKHQVGE